MTCRRFGNIWTCGNDRQVTQRHRAWVARVGATEFGRQVGETFDPHLEEMRKMGSFGADFGAGLAVFTRWLQVMFGIDLGIG